jgi:hypothetical protein
VGAPQENVWARSPGRPRKWPGGAVHLSIYVPIDLREEIERRATARNMSISEYAVSLMLRGLEIEKETEKDGDAR